MTFPLPQIPSLRAIAPSKPLIMSVTGSAAEVATIVSHVNSLPTAAAPAALEVNLSCPNIPGKPAVRRQCRCRGVCRGPE